MNQPPIARGTAPISQVIHAITSSPLPTWERLAVIVLAVLYRPGSDGVTMLSVTAFAAEVGVAIKTARAFLERLQTAGVLAFEERSKGGRSAGGGGHAHRLRIDRCALLRFAGFTASPVPGDDGSGAPQEPSPALSPPNNPVAAAGQNPEAAVANPFRDGRAMGVRGCLRASGSDSIQPNPTTPTTTSGSVVVAEDARARAEKAMLHLGMAPFKASELSRAHPIDHIERGIRYVRAAKNAKGPVGLFITMLTNGDFSKGPPPTPSPTIGARLVPPSRMRMWQLLEHRSIRIRARFREDAQRYLRAIDACWNDRLPTPEEISDELLRRAFEGDLDALREMADRASAVAAAA